MAFRSGSKLSPLERRTPRNPKYADVRGKLDTGCNELKIKLISTRQYLKSRDELFKRVRGRQLVELMDEYESLLDGGGENFAAYAVPAIKENVEEAAAKAEAAAASAAAAGRTPAAKRSYAPKSPFATMLDEPGKGVSPPRIVKHGAKDMSASR